MTVSRQEPRAVTVVGSGSDPPAGESRLWPAAALIVFLGFNITVRLWLWDEAPLRVPWLLPATEVVLLVLLLGADPRGRTRHSRWLRRVALTVVVLLVLAALWSTAILVYDIVKGIGVTTSPTELLATGALVWLGNNLAFALLYWMIDSGGPIARLQLPTPVDFAFTQH